MTIVAYLDAIKTRLMTDPVVATYNYHWADATNQLIQRWDNTPHHPEVSGFPHHAHARANDVPIPGQAMTVFTVLDEVSQRLS